MISESKKYQVDILDETYYLISDETESDIEKIVSIVNSSIKEIIAKSPQIDHKKAISFAALKIAEKVLKAEGMLVRLEQANLNIVKKIEQELL